MRKARCGRHGIGREGPRIVRLLDGQVAAELAGSKPVSGLRQYLLLKVDLIDLAKVALAAHHLRFADLLAGDCLLGH